MMDHRLGETREDGIMALLSESDKAQPRGLARLLKRMPFLYVVFFPFLLLYLLALFLRMQVSMFRLTVVGPLLMRVWRTRRFMADATAVQLTRNPDGLAMALGDFAEHGAAVPGGQWFAHLFVVGPEAAPARDDRALAGRMADLRQRTGKTAAGAAAAAGEAARTVANEIRPADTRSEKTWAKELAGVPSHPSILQRVHRLAALGASVGASGPRPMPRQAPQRYGVGRYAMGAVGVVLVAPLLALAGFLMAFAMSAIFMFGLVAAVFFMGMAMAGIHALLT
jgi:hypothetical protein